MKLRNSSRVMLISSISSNPMKAFEWGTDVSIENMHQGFTHIFESTFESTEGVAEYISHPAHVDFGGLFLPALEKVVVFDYKPTVFRL
ncbi:STRESS-RESPONSE A/B BARREL DOMAIN-CONTAINING PROTEIN HS1 [Salix koriyanagi]|uniref:STRESS-RESPONSE A/B BARREL DOMAIN-CONTAINING PROTEIN HS1 n=1 Tax=Salix koriyanagi TaxID=2511006 RepID=A0A9Q0WQM5_9ROSI|nr:STRESS-RESPONSE A/B BARREL DOMAIN-CONTAINING PROTEIN HS1 [Salix koriyanagi]